MVNRRSDGWTNLVTGLGTTEFDKSVNTCFSYAIPPIQFQDDVLANMYHTDGLAQRIVNLPVDEAFRPGYVLKLDGQPADADVLRYLNSYELNRKISDAARWGRLYGGGGLLYFTDQDSEEPLRLRTLKTVHQVLSLERRDFTPSDFQHTFGDLVFNTKYLFQPVKGHSATVHRSHLTILPGQKTSPREKFKLQGWDYSVLVLVQKELASYADNWGAIGTLIQESSLGVFKLKDLHQKMAKPGGQDQIETRIQLVDLSKSVARSVIVDAEHEDYTRVDTSTFSGLADLTNEQKMRISAVTGIPVAWLFGQAPAGMNSTGEHDREMFYNMVDDYRIRDLEPRLIDAVTILLSADDSPLAGQVGEVTIEWSSLWNLSQKEQEELDTAKTNRLAVQVQNQILQPEEAFLLLHDENYAPDTQLRKELLESENLNAIAVVSQPPALSPGQPTQAVVERAPDRAVENGPVVQSDLEGVRKTGS